MRKFKAQLFVDYYNSKNQVIKSDYEEKEFTEEEILNHIKYNKLLRNSMTNVVYHGEKVTEAHISYYTIHKSTPTQVPQFAKILYKRNYYLLEEENDK